MIQWWFSSTAGSWDDFHHHPIICIMMVKTWAGSGLFMKIAGLNSSANHLLINPPACSCRITLCDKSKRMKVKVWSANPRAAVGSPSNDTATTMIVWDSDQTLEKRQLYPVQMALPWWVLPNRHPSEEVEKNSSARVEGDIPETPQLLCLYTLRQDSFDWLVFIKRFDSDFPTSSRLIVPSKKLKQSRTLQRYNISFLQ